MTGGYLKGRIRREDIITAAVAVYAEAGYHGSSLREVARRVGITHAGLLYYFPTKEALLAAVLERRDAEDAERERLTVPPGLQALRHLLALAEHNARNPGIVYLHTRLAAEAVAPDHPAHAYFEKHYALARGYAAASFAVLAGQGELRNGVDPEMAALDLIALMDGLQVQWLSNRATRSIRSPRCGPTRACSPSRWTRRFSRTDPSRPAARAAFRQCSAPAPTARR